MQPVIALTLPPPAPAGPGPLSAWLAAVRRANAERLAERFRGLGAADVRIDAGRPDGRTFGERLRTLAAEGGPGAGLVVLGSGAIPLARRRDLGELLDVAGSGERRALANSFHSADVVAIGAASNLAAVPDLPSDNALPRWLREAAGYQVDDRRRRWRLAVDIDSPLDAVLLAGTVPDRDAGAPAAPPLPALSPIASLAPIPPLAPLPALPAGFDAASVHARIDGLRAVARDSGGQLVVAGRTGSATLRWLERRTASRTRALVEERGLRAIGLAADRAGRGQRPPTSGRGQRPPRSVLGMLLDARGPGAIGAILADLGDAAVVDSRVLLAHRLGADEGGWPSPEDRYAADLLLAERVGDPWLRKLTAGAREAAIPVLLGGHTLVGPGLRLAIGPAVRTDARP